MPSRTFSLSETGESDRTGADREARLDRSPKENILPEVYLSRIPEAAKALVLRAKGSAVLWSWGMNGVRLASGILLLPLLASKLGKPEFGMYYVFLSMTALLPFLDLGLSGSIGRFLSYALAGATELKAQGLPSLPQSKGPSFPTLWKLLFTTRTLYKYVALIGFIVMGVWGTILVDSQAHKTANPMFTWAAWWLTLLSATLELYSIWWNTFLYCLNRVHESARINFIAYSTRLLLSCIFLLTGMGLMSVPAASIVGCLWARFSSKRLVLRFLGPPPENLAQISTASFLALLFPNSWRLALQVLSSYLRSSATVQICVAYFGLTATGEYGLSLQMMNIAAGMATVWISVKWPRVGQLRSEHNFEALRRLLWPRFWLQILSFVLLSALAILAGAAILRELGTDKQLLPASWLWLLAVSFGLEMTFISWGTLLAAENRIPTLWSTVITNISALLLALTLSHYSSLGMLSLVVAPLIAGSAFLYWYWPMRGAQSLGTTWWRFMFTRPI